MAMIPPIHPTDEEILKEEMPPIGAPYHNDDPWSRVIITPDEETKQLIEAMWEGAYNIIGLR